MTGHSGSPLVLRWRRYSLLLHRRSIAVALVLALLVLVLALWALMHGKLALPPLAVLKVLLGDNAPPLHQQIIVSVRLPRMLTALLVGAALGIAGAVFQSISRNPLGSPDIVGFTTGAASGALLPMMLLTGGNDLAVAAGALLGGLATALVVYGLARVEGEVSSYRLILMGIGVGATLMAFNGLLLIKGDLDDAMMANLWLAGSLHARTWAHVWPLLAGMVLLLPLLLAGARSLTLLEMGDDVAAQLGVRVERVRLWMMLAAVMLAALATAAAGPVAFIALAAPQLARRLTRGVGVPVASAALMGSLLLLAADLLTQSLPFRAHVPIGRVTGIVGGLYLLALLTRMRRI